MDTGQKLRGMFSEEQLAALDAVRGKLMQEPEALDHRRENIPEEELA